ncbi:TPX2 isoform X4 [Spatholobus suberectus]|nr:TPX2 isoform X4 [Spatholobus suberectus]
MTFKVVTGEQNTACSKLKLTIPREPSLKTTHKSTKDNARKCCRGRACGSRRSQIQSLFSISAFWGFHLKTLENVMQHTFATSSSLHRNDSNKLGHKEDHPLEE